MMKLKAIFGITLLSAITGAVIASLATSNLINAKKPTAQDLIMDFYQTENAVHVSPHSCLQGSQYVDFYRIREGRKRQDNKFIPGTRK